MKVKLIIGLGNPDKEYENTYHNVGILALDLIEKPPLAKAFKPDTYMNQSGLFVAKIAKKNGVRPEEILIIHDDSDIKLGKYKLSFGRNSAGHRGVQSIIDSLGTKDFWRLRIGIRKNVASSKYKVSRARAGDFVLKKITKTDWEILKGVFSRIDLQSDDNA